MFLWPDETSILNHPKGVYRVDSLLLENDIDYLLGLPHGDNTMFERIILADWHKIIMIVAPLSAVTFIFYKVGQIIP